MFFFLNLYRIIFYGATTKFYTKTTIKNDLMIPFSRLQQTRPIIQIKESSTWHNLLRRRSNLCRAKCRQLNQQRYPSLSAEFSTFKRQLRRPNEPKWIAFFNLANEQTGGGKRFIVPELPRFRLHSKGMSSTLHSLCHFVLREKRRFSFFMTRTFPNSGVTT